MFHHPTSNDVLELAGSFGFTLDSVEVDAYRAAIIDQLVTFDAFMHERLDESPTEVSHPNRDPGYRPSVEEDPYNAWLWKCHIEGAPDGLLTGKTVSFKDHTAVAGIPCTFGTYALDGFVPDFDATVVSRVLAAGGTITGKNVMDGLAGVKGYNGTSSGDYGRPLNPHDPACLTGGSSSGSGAALAAAEVDISFGGDQGGSIRSPASWCGVVGLKPTFGLVSHFGVGFGSEPSIDYVGPMARNVEDVAAALQAVAGFDGLDPRQDRTLPTGIDALSHLDDGVDGLRIGMLEEGFDDETDPDVRDAVLEAIDELQRAGAAISRISVPEHVTARSAAAALGLEGSRAIRDAGFFGAYSRTQYPTRMVVAVGRAQRDGAGSLPARTKLSLMVSEYSRRNFHGAVYAKAHNVRSGVIAAFDAAFAQVDVLVLPTSPTVPNGGSPQRRSRSLLCEQRARHRPATASPSTTRGIRR